MSTQYLPFPLLEEEVLACTEVTPYSPTLGERTDSTLAERTLSGSKLGWGENEVRANLKVRVQFINELVQKTMAQSPDKKAPLTIVSLGSGKLLTEYFIHQQLAKHGYTDIRWRCIDPVYSDEKTKDSRVAFGKHATQAMAFTTEQAYLKKQIENGSNLAQQDRQAGLVIMIIILPPFEMPASPDAAMMVGGLCHDVAKANSLYCFPVGSKVDNAYITTSLQNGKACWIQNSFKLQLSTDKNVIYDDGMKGASRALSVFLKEYNAIPLKVEDLSSLKIKVAQTIEGLHSNGMVLLMSDYMTSISLLREFFKQNLLVGTLDWNQSMIAMGER